MLVRDEADIIEVTVRHLLFHVDEVLVTVFPSTDGTREILEALPIRLRFEPEVRHSQPEEMTALAMEALERGHEWLVPCDADEIWHYRYSDQRIADFLETLEVMVAKARIFTHIPTSEDPPDENPVKRIGYRHTRPKKFKVACRLGPELRIGTGNHRVHYGTEAAMIRKGLEVRHFPFRSEEQSVRKYRNQAEAWGRDTARLGGLFSECPAEDDSLVYDPAPLRS